jgi:hypothetical protein
MTVPAHHLASALETDLNAHHLTMTLTLSLSQGKAWAQNRLFVGCVDTMPQSGGKLDVVRSQTNARVRGHACNLCMPVIYSQWHPLQWLVAFIGTKALAGMAWLVSTPRRPWFKCSVTEHGIKASRTEADIFSLGMSCLCRTMPIRPHEATSKEVPEKQELSRFHSNAFEWNLLVRAWPYVTCSN